MRRRLDRDWDWEFASRSGGRLVHAIPAGDGVHLDEHDDLCRCQPWTERFLRADGGYGQAVYHRRMFR